MRSSEVPNHPDASPCISQVRQLQRRLFVAAKRQSGGRFHALHDRIGRRCVLVEASRRGRGHGSTRRHATESAGGRPIAAGATSLGFGDNPDVAYPQWRYAADSAYGARSLATSDRPKVAGGARPACTSSRHAKVMPHPHESWIRRRQLRVDGRPVSSLERHDLTAIHGVRGFKRDLCRSPCTPAGHCASVRSLVASG